MKEIEKNKYDYESGYAVISDKISYDNLLLDTHLNIDKNVFSVNTEMTTSIISFVIGLKTKWIKPRIGVVDYVWMVIIGLSILFFIDLLHPAVSLDHIYQIIYDPVLQSHDHIQIPKPDVRIDHHNSST